MGLKSLAQTRPTAKCRLARTLGRINTTCSHMYLNPTQENQQDFLCRLYFGASEDKLELIIQRAYLDFSRTVTGAAKYPNAHQSASQLLRNEISTLPNLAINISQARFDDWHEKICHSLCSEYSKAGYEHFYIGQAQKWLNMAMKYVYVIGEDRLRGYAPLYSMCHVPIDNIILQSPQFKGLVAIEEAWSRISEYATYFAFQLAARRKYPSWAPLAVEFWAWQGRNAA